MPKASGASAFNRHWITGSAAGKACRCTVGSWSTTASCAVPTLTVSVSRSPLNTPLIASGPIQPLGPVTYASKLAANVAAATPAGSPDSRSFRRMPRSPSAIRKTGVASANPTGAAGRLLRPKGGQCGAVAASGAPSPSAESATGANDNR